MCKIHYTVYLHYAYRYIHIQRMLQELVRGNDDSLLKTQWILSEESGGSGDMQREGRLKNRESRCNQGTHLSIYTLANIFENIASFQNYVNFIIFIIFFFPLSLSLSLPSLTLRSVMKDNSSPTSSSPTRRVQYRRSSSDSDKAPAKGGLFKSTSQQPAHYTVHPDWASEHTTGVNTRK